MTQLAVGYREAASGRQQRTDGLLKHLGLIEAGSLRAMANLTNPYPKTGQGLELVYEPSNKTAFVFAFDREQSTYLDLNLQGKNVTITPTGGGTLTLPPNCVGSSQIQDGSIQTADIAANAVQQLIGQAVTNSSWTTTAVNQWVTTGISAVFTTGGGLLRFEFNSSFYHSVGAAGFYYGLGIDTSNPSMYWYTLAHQSPSGSLNCSGTYYNQVAAGVHTVYIVAYNTSTGTLGQIQVGYHTLYVTEQKR